MNYDGFFVIWAVLFFVSHITVRGQSHSRCPSSCQCDFAGDNKHVRCELADSSVPVDFRNIDSDVQMLDILPRQRGDSRDAYGPSLPPNFDGLQKLDYLVLRSTSLRAIPSNTARQLASVRTLDLAGNDIEDFSDLSLDSLPAVQVFQVSNNKFSEINDDSLRPLRNLESFAANNNNIRKISTGAFQNQPFLIHLELSGNQLQDLPASVFDSIQRLGHLDLSKNNFQEIPRGIQRLTALEVLVFDGNRLTTIPSQLVSAWSHSPDLLDAHFYDNPLQCDDQLSDFVSWTQSKNGNQAVCVSSSVNRKSYNRDKNGCPTCGGPASFKGQTVDRVRASNLQPLAMQDASRPKPSKLVDPGYQTVTVVDSVRAPNAYDPRRDAANQAITKMQKETAAKLKQFMPGAGVRCNTKKCYYFSAKGVSEWRTAEYFCQSVGLDLLEIDDKVEQKELMQFLKEAVIEDFKRSSPSRGWWIGYRYDPASKSFRSAATGKTLTYTNWAEGQPSQNNHAGECVELWDVGDWNDTPCVMPSPNQFVCESPANIGVELKTQGTNIKKSSNMDVKAGGSRKVSGSSSISSSSSSSSSGDKQNFVTFTVVN